MCTVLCIRGKEVKGTRLGYSTGTTTYNITIPSPATNNGDDYNDNHWRRHGVVEYKSTDNVDQTTIASWKSTLNQTAPFFSTFSFSFLSNNKRKGFFFISQRDSLFVYE